MTLVKRCITQLWPTLTRPDAAPIRTRERIPPRKAASSLRLAGACLSGMVRAYISLSAGASASITVRSTFHFLQKVSILAVALSRRAKYAGDPLGSPLAWWQIGRAHV